MDTETFAISRWKRYGKDRAYIADAHGTQLGYADLATGELSLEEGCNSRAIASALWEWCAEQDIELLRPPNPGLGDATTEATGDAGPAIASAVAPENPSNNEPKAAPQPEWTDLATNRPGEGVRQLANEEWAAAKGRSRVFSTLNRYVFDSHTDERAWRKGAEGEEFVGDKLNKLREKGWHVLHSVPVGKGDSDIDHIVIGPGGVFTVNSKKHDGKKIWVAKYQMRVNGQPVPYLRNSRHEATRAKRLLEAHLPFEVPVMGCVVVLTGSLIPEVTYKQMPDDVCVLDKWDVPRWFKKRPAVLDPDQVASLFEVARRSTTWRSAP